VKERDTDIERFSREKQGEYSPVFRMGKFEERTVVCRKKFQKGKKKKGGSVFF